MKMKLDSHAVCSAVLEFNHLNICNSCMVITNKYYYCKHYSCNAFQIKQSQKFAFHFKKVLNLSNIFHKLKCLQTFCEI